MRIIQLKTRVELTNEIEVDPHSDIALGEAINQAVYSIYQQHGPMVDRVTVSGLKGLRIKVEQLDKSKKAT